jgi:hypothetical protein
VAFDVRGHVDRRGLIDEAWVEDFHMSGVPVRCSGGGTDRITVGFKGPIKVQNDGEFVKRRGGTNPAYTYNEVFKGQLVNMVFNKARGSYSQTFAFAGGSKCGTFGPVNWRAKELD